MSREILEEAFRHFELEGRRYEYGRGDMRLRNGPNGALTDQSRTEQDLDGDGRRGVDCSSLVWRGLHNAGYDVGETPFTTSKLFQGNTIQPYARQHFDVVPAAEASRNHGGLQEGDIILFTGRHGQHVGIFRGYDAQGHIQFYGSQVSTGPALVNRGTEPGGYWNGDDFHIVGALRAKPEFQVREPMHGRNNEEIVPLLPPGHHAPHGNEGAPHATHNHATARHDGTMQRGDVSDAVRDMQGKLAHLGYRQADGRPLQADREYGAQTFAAIQLFQRDHHLKPDGIAGPQTLAALQRQVQAYDAARGTTPGEARPQLNEAAHPDHAMYRQALEGVHRLDAQHGRPSGNHSENLAAALTVAAKRDGLREIHHVILNEDASHAYAVQGELHSPLKQLASVPTAQAAKTPVAASNASLEILNRQLDQQQTAQERRGHFLELIGELRAERAAEREAHHRAHHPHV